MRILCIIDCLRSGGAQRQMTYLACGLKQRGHDVELFLTHLGADHFRREIEAAGTSIHDVDGGHTGFSWRVPTAIFRLLDKGFDSVARFQLSASGFLALASMLSVRWRMRVVSGERASSAHEVRLSTRLGVGGTAVLSTRTVANKCSYASYLPSRRMRMPTSPRRVQRSAASRMRSFSRSLKRHPAGRDAPSGWVDESFGMIVDTPDRPDCLERWRVSHHH